MDHEHNKHSQAKHPGATTGEKSGGAHGHGDAKADHHEHHAHGESV